MADKINIALDIGTTTIAGAAVDQATGRLLSGHSAENPQKMWGMDLITRLNALIEDPRLLKEFSRVTVGACNGIIAEVSGGREAAEIAVAGNTVMEHVFLGISPAGMAKVPYRPAFKEAKRLKAGDAGLKAGPDTLLYVFPLIGGFVGGDAVAAALYLNMRLSDKTVLAIDVGTNSEVMLSFGGNIYAASAPAGPAFEASGISSGMRAGKGAIQGVAIEGDKVTLDVIGGGQAKGICGSGLLSAAGALLTAGAMEKSGRLRNRSEIPGNLANRIREDNRPGNSFVLFRGPSGEISLSQSDIRSLQSAKAAIRAAVEVLMTKAGAGLEEIEEVCLAGAFGESLSDDGLFAIGLLDRGLKGKLRFAGDAALLGAACVAGNEDKKHEAERIAKEAKYISLSGTPAFEREFIKHMDF